jgi:hypothetical protein
MSPDIRDASALWYPGGRILIDNKVKEYEKYGLTDISTAGVYAALSPQKDWDQNVYLGDRLIDIYLTKQDAPYDAAMEKRAAYLRNKPSKRGDVKAALQRIDGKKLSELTETKDKAMWVRLYDEAHGVDAEGNDIRHYAIVRPDGTRGDLARNADGKLSNAAWGGLAQIEDAIEAIEAKGDRSIISKAFSEKHKVRSFYDNLLDPFSTNNDVTVDTHAVAAAWMMPMSGKSVAVNHSMQSYAGKGVAGASASSAVGISGTYPVYGDALRELAAELKITPRALQSITWVARRERFNENMTDKQKADVEKVWKDFQNGRIDLNDAHDQLDKIVPMRTPAWAT